MAIPENWHLPLIAVGVGFHLAVSWALLWRYFQAKERSLLTWGLAWLVLAIHVLGMFLTRMGFDAAAPLLRDVTFAGAALAFFGGQVEREGRAYRSLARGAGVAAAVILTATFAGTITGAPVTYASTATVVLCMVGSAWLSAPTGSGRTDITRWLLFSGYLVGALHALAYVIPLPMAHAVPVEITGHALFSLLFSAAVTWQAWEHERAVRLFSQMLERLNRPLTTREALDEALRLVADTLHVSHGWILLRERGRGGAAGGWLMAAALGFPDWALHGLNHHVFPIDACLCLQPVDRKALVTNMTDLACVRLTDEVGHRAGRHVTIPLGANGKVQGLMVMMVPANRFIGPADIELLTAMGEQIGLALDRARLYDKLRAKEEARGRLLAQVITAQEDERRRIARELHDETGQALTALVVNLDFLVRNPVPEEALRKRLAGVRDMAEDTLAEVRRVIHEMRPTVLDDLGLEAAIRWLVKRYEPSGLKVKLAFEGLEERLPGHLEITLFRIIQEACTNTVKHAGADTLEIRVARSQDQIHLEVRDNGKGFDPARLQRHRGMGLPGLRERVTLAGGTLTIDTAPGQGTKLAATLPVPDLPPDRAEDAVTGGGSPDDDPRADLRRSHDGPARRSHGAAIGAGH